MKTNLKLLKIYVFFKFYLTLHTSQRTRVVLMFDKYMAQEVFKFMLTDLVILITVCGNTSTYESIGSKPQPFRDTTQGTRRLAKLFL